MKLLQSTINQKTEDSKREKSSDLVECVEDLEVFVFFRESIELLAQQNVGLRHIRENQADLSAVRLVPVTRAETKLASAQ